MCMYVVSSLHLFLFYLFYFFGVLLDERFSNFKSDLDDLDLILFFFSLKEIKKSFFFVLVALNLKCI